MIKFNLKEMLEEIKQDEALNRPKANLLSQAEIKELLSKRQKKKIATKP